MNPRFLIVPAWLALAATATAQQLPGTLNYRNVTAARINQVFAEQASNEKEVEWGDFDNDNDLDVVIAVAHSDFGQRNNKLYRNDNGVFNEISNLVPLFLSGDVARNAFFRDYNQDGWLDIIVICDNNTGGDGGRTKIWINQHNAGVHTGWIEDGLARLGASTGGAACSGVSFDPDNDGDFDLYVANYPGPSQDTMYLNNGAGFFTNVTGSMIPSDSDYSVDASTADLNGDGTIDLIIGNGFNDPNFVYYNDNLGAGTQIGDFSYASSTQILGNGASENAMEPGDFDNDGDMDAYWTNRSGSADRILVNSGLLANNQVSWIESANLPPSVLSVTSRKATVADLNGDGRLDVFVMKEAGGSSRPSVLRNITVNQHTIQFIDWTPAVTFPSGSTLMGWHAGIADSDGDGDPDIFVGGWSNDYLFEQVPGLELTEDEIPGGALNNIFNGRPTAIVGTAGLAESDTYVLNNLGTNAFVSVVLSGPDDYLLEILDAGGGVLTTVNRGAAGVEEAIQYDPAGSPTTLQLRVTTQGCGAEFDLDGDCNVGINDLLALLADWGNPYDINDLLDLLATWGTTSYQLEILSRAG